MGAFSKKTIVAGISSTLKQQVRGRRLLCPLYRWETEAQSGKGTFLESQSYDVAQSGLEIKTSLVSSPTFPEDLTLLCLCSTANDLQWAAKRCQRIKRDLEDQSSRGKMKAFESDQPEFKSQSAFD